MREKEGPMRTSGIRIAATALAALLAASVASASVAKSFDQARADAARAGLPVLVKFGSLSCGSCKEFDEAVENDPSMRKAIEGKVVLCILNGTEGEAGVLSRTYSVSQRPSFVLTDAHGDTMDRWNWYADVASFREALEEALAEPMTVTARFARFRENPTEHDASKIAQIRHHESLFGEAVTWYRRAQALNPESATHYDAKVFDCYAYGTMYQLFEPSALAAQADVVFASKRSDEKDLMNVVYAMAKVFERTGDAATYAPYLRAGFERTAGSTNEKVLKMRRQAAADHALLVQHDEKRAVSLCKETQKEGWQEDANALNNFAWWCFKRGINLDEAAKCARKGIERAEPGTQKANIYDTLAEICNVNGDCEDAVELVKLAVKEDPANEYFRKQLDRFEKILLAQE
jgi:tetratricopeptide (TPR) repeat protein